MAAVPKTCKVILADSIAKNLLAEVQATRDAFRKEHNMERQLCLTAFLANDDPHAVKYAEWSQKTCQDNGIDFVLHRLDKEDLEAAIMAANTDDAVDGIIVYYPVFPGSLEHDRYIQETVALNKDVEGMCHRHLHNMYHNIRFLDDAQQLKSILPCTPLAVVKILEHLHVYNTVIPYGNRLYGKTITVINRSEVNGRPLAALLANDGATVYSVDLTGVQVFTRGEGIKDARHRVHDKDASFGLAQCLPLSDVVIGGVPAEQFKVPTELLRPGAVCVNFSSFRNFDGPAVKERASIYVPSVGKVTIAVLLRNLVRLCANRKAAGGKLE